MSHIKVTRGLNIPIEGEPVGAVKNLEKPRTIAFPFSSFENIRFRVLVNPGDRVKIGQPLAEDKRVPGCFFVSPGGGVIREVRRGEKRRLLAISIDLDIKEEWVEFPVKKLEDYTKDEIINLFLKSGIFAHIKARPFERLAHPNQLPRSIFVKAVESAPFVPSAEIQIDGKEKEFQAGISILKKLTSGQVHLVYKEGSSAFNNVKEAEKHTISGPHPSGNSSVHIHHIDPIKSVNDLVWTVNVTDCIMIGSLILHGRIDTDRIISIAGPAVLPQMRGFYRGRLGCSISELFHGKTMSDGPIRYVSGDLLTGEKATEGDFLGFSHTTTAALFENTKREFLHFFRLGANKFTASGAYLSGHMNWNTHKWNFTTNQHGEKRAFVDGSIYERVMPIQILPMQLIRAIQAEDFEWVEKLGLLEVVTEDFALPEFVCPCKIEMMNILKAGLRQHLEDTLG